MTERAVRWSLLGASTVLSSGGIAFGLWFSGNPTDGGRGGAIAVAMALSAYFLRKEIGRSVRRSLIQTGPDIDRAIGDWSCPSEPRSAAGSELDPVYRRLEAIEATSSIEANSERKMNRAAAVASAIGTMAWGFGDLVVLWWR